MIATERIRQSKRIWRVAALGAAALALALLVGLQGGGAAHAQGGGAFLDDAPELPPDECGRVQALNAPGVAQRFEWKDQCYSQSTRSLTRSAYIRFNLAESGHYRIVVDAPRDATFIAVFDSAGRHVESSIPPEADRVITYSPMMSSIENAFLRADTYWLQVLAERDPPVNEAFTLTVLRIARAPDPPPPPSEPVPDAGCRVHGLDLNVADSGTWSNSCQGIDLEPPIARGESCYSSDQAYRFSRYYRLDITEEAQLQVAYDGADCVRVLNGNEDSNNKGKALGRGAGEGSITDFFLVDNSFMEIPVEAFPEGRYLIELTARSPGPFTLRVCDAGQSCRIERAPPPAATSPTSSPIPATTPPEPPEDTGAPVLQVIIGAAVAALIIVLAWILIGRSRNRRGGVQ